MGNDNIKKRWNKHEIFTIPNAMSVFRILLLPLLVWLYSFKHDYVAALIVLLISGATDVVDGFIARHFNQVSEVGKFIDPVADKLTQCVVGICLALRYPLMWALIGALILKEIMMFTGGLLILRRNDKINSAQWYGKACTAILEIAMMILILTTDKISMTAVNVMIWCLIVMIVVTMLLYARFYAKQLRRAPADKTEDKNNK